MATRTAMVASVPLHTHVFSNGKYCTLNVIIYCYHMLRVWFLYFRWPRSSRSRYSECKSYSWYVFFMFVDGLHILKCKCFAAGGNPFLAPNDSNGTKTTVMPPVVLPSHPMVHGKFTSPRISINIIDVFFFRY
jgi:hypothetical protein